jgi:Outer membrane protein beta-barrel domain
MKIIFINFLIISAFFGLIIEQTVAQKDKQKRFSASVVMGANVSQIDGDGEAGFNQLGLNLGGRANIYLAKRLDISTEILFSQKGSQSAFVRDQPRNMQCRLNYVEIPLQINFKDWEISDNDNGNSYMRIVFGAGMTYGRLLGGSYVIGGVEQDMAQFKNSDISILFTGTAYINRHWGINLGWSRSLISTTVNSSANRWISGNNANGAAVNRNIILRIFYTFQ